LDAGMLNFVKENFVIISDGENLAISSNNVWMSRRNGQN
jgi:hypothetical protein